MASGTIKAVVSKSDIVNNLTTNDSTKVLSAAQGKTLKDASDTLNSKVNVKIIGSCSSLSAIVNVLDTELASMDNDSNLNIRITATNNFAPFKNNIAYTGVLHKISSSTTYSHVEFYPDGSMNPIVGNRYGSSGWTFDELALNDQIENKNTITGLTGTGATIGSTYISRIGYIVSVSVVFTVTAISGFNIAGLPNAATNYHVCLAYDNNANKAIPMTINVDGKLEFADNTGVSVNDSLRLVTTYLSASAS